MNFKREARNGECLDEDLISGYLEGVLTPVVKAACEDHLIVCDGCRERLANFMRLLRPETDAEEEMEINAALARWDGRQVQPVSSTSGLASRKQTAFRIGGMVAALLLVAVVFWPQPSADDIVLGILKTKRPFMAQLANQPYVALNVTRSSGDEISFEPLAEEMKKRAADTYQWGRFYLAFNQYDDAIRELERLASGVNAPAEVHNDLGAAYLERDNKGDSERAGQAFNAALHQDDRFLPAIYNLSLLYERDGIPAKAQELRKRYLELDTKSGFAGEISTSLSRKESR